MHKSECPGPESIAALVDGRLSDGEARRLRAHVADCASCIEIVGEVVHFMSDQAAVPRAPQVPSIGFARLVRSSRTWWAAAAALLVVVSGALFLRTGQPQDDGLGQLVAAVGERRLVEARVTGGFKYAPIESPERGPRPLDRSDPRDWRVFEAASKIHRGAGQAPSSAAQARALGVAHLVLGNDEDAVQALESADRASPGDARILSDLAAAYIARADRAGRADDYVRAIDAARHAVTLDPRCAEAQFNLALALEKQIASASAGAAADQGRAIAAWQDYLRLDADSPWAAEARQRLAALQGHDDGALASPGTDDVEKAVLRLDADRTEALAGLTPRVGREVLERRLLPAWAGAVREGRTEAADRALAASTALAEAGRGVSGDRFADDVVAAAARARSSADAIAWTARGFLEYQQGIALHDRGDEREAGNRFRAAREALDRVGNPLRWSAAVYLSICDYYTGRGTEARRDLDRIAADIATRPYPGLLARVRWMQGLLSAVSGDLSRSLGLYEESLALFLKASELDGAASAHFLIAENLDFLGDRDEAWGHRATALALASHAPADQRRSILLDAAFAALDQNLPWAALSFHEPLLEPWSAADPGARGEALHVRARILGETGDLDAALSDLNAATAALGQVVDPDFAQRLAAELDETRGDLLLRREPGKAVAPLQEASKFFSSTGAASRLPALHLNLGRAHEALGSFGDAESDYVRGIEELERSSARLLLEPHRISFLDHTWTLYDAVIRLEAERLGSPGRAFGFAERARSADLLAPETCDAERAAGTPDIEAIARELPVGVAMIYLVLEPERLLRWVVRTGEVEFRPQTTAAETVEGMVRDVRRAVAANDEAAFRTAAAGLYDVIVRPVEDRLLGVRELRFVPDRRLNDVPFAALLDRDSGGYLVERFATGVAPTARSLVSRGRRPQGAGGRVLVVGNPAFDAGRHPGLDPLPEAEAEARGVASLYAGSVLLTGSAATSGRVRAETAGAAIIHFAGHALVNDRYPLLSALVLAPDRETGDPGLLTARDLQQIPMDRVRLIVLGACRAAAGGAARPGGEFNLARPFLAAGVPEVVGTLWPVRDRQAAELLLRFHREFQRGVTAAQGLRDAQVAMMHGPNHDGRSPLSWGAFVVNGTALR